MIILVPALRSPTPQLRSALRSDDWVVNCEQAFQRATCVECTAMREGRNSASASDFCMSRVLMLCFRAHHPLVQL